MLRIKNKKLNRKFNFLLKFKQNTRATNEHYLIKEKILLQLIIANILIIHTKNYKIFTFYFIFTLKCQDDSKEFQEFLSFYLPPPNVYFLNGVILVFFIFFQRTTIMQT